MAKNRKQPNQSATDADSLTRIRTGVPREQQVKSPLTSEHLVLLNQIIDECTQTAEMCRICHDAGVDISPEMQANNEQLKMATALKSGYFPHSS